MPLSEEEKEAIKDSATIKVFEKETILLREGQIAKECYFVLKGCVRQYYLVDGDERTSNFFTESQWVASLTSFIQQIPSNHYLTCLEECVLVVGNSEKEHDLYQKFPKFESLSRSIMGHELGRQQEIMATYITDSPEQRYLNLQKSRPGLIQRVPQYQLASYIGVKPESLSRIRKRLHAKKQG